MQPPNEARYLCMVPYDPAEGFSLKEAAAFAGKSETTVRNWCEAHGVGRRIVGGQWRVSKPALAMLLDGDEVTLLAYLSGDRASPIIRSYFGRFGLSPRY